MSRPSPPSKPDLILGMFEAFKQTEALKTAIELDLFTAISEGNDSTSSLATRCRTSSRGIRILCDYLAIHGLLSKSEDHYRLSPEAAEYLVRTSASYVGGAIYFLTSPLIREGFRSLPEAVRKGGTAIHEEGSLAPEHPVWVEFARNMAPLLKPAAEFVARLVREHHPEASSILDIAAGHGLFGIAVARSQQQAKIYAVDWPAVLEVARENALKAKVLDRYQLIAGNAFEVDYRNGHDVALIANFLHHFDLETCKQLLKKVSAALAAGGLLVVLDYIPDPDRLQPARAGAFSLTMLAMTPAGDAFTFDELSKVLQDTNFVDCTLHAVPAGQQRAILCRKRQ